MVGQGDGHHKTETLALGFAVDKRVYFWEQIQPENVDLVQNALHTDKCESAFGGYPGPFKALLNVFPVSLTDLTTVTHSGKQKNLPSSTPVTRFSLFSTLCKRFFPTTQIQRISDAHMKTAKKESRKIIVSGHIPELIPPNTYMVIHSENRCGASTMFQKPETQQRVEEPSSPLSRTRYSSQGRCTINKK